MPNNNSLVSIIMPCYNAGKYIVAAIESVQAQSYTEWELIIIDDCSSDNSMELVKQKAKEDSRIKYFMNEVNSGAAITRNNAIAKANGQYIAFLDSDDLYLPNKLEKQLLIMQKYNISFCFSWYNIINEGGKYLDKFVPAIKKITYDNLLCHNYVGLLTVMLDKDKLGDEIEFRNMAANEDYALWLQLLKKAGKAYCINEPLANYRLVSDSISSNKGKVAKHIWKIFRETEEFSLPKSIYYFLRYLFYYTFNKLKFINYRNS